MASRSSAPVGGGDPALRAAVRPPPGDPVVLGKAGEVEQAVGIAAVLQPGTHELGHTVGKAAADQDHDSTQGAAGTTARSSVRSATRASRMRARVGKAKCSSRGTGSTITTARPPRTGATATSTKVRCASAAKRDSPGSRCDRLGRHRAVPDHRVADDAGERWRRRAARSGRPVPAPAGWRDAPRSRRRPGGSLRMRSVACRRRPRRRPGRGGSGRRGPRPGRL